MMAKYEQKWTNNCEFEWLGLEEEEDPGYITSDL